MKVLGRFSKKWMYCSLEIENGEIRFHLEGIIKIYNFDLESIMSCTDEVDFQSCTTEELEILMKHFKEYLDGEGKWKRQSKMR